MKGLGRLILVGMFGTCASGFAQSDDFDSIKRTLQAQSPQVFALKRQQLVAEGPRGFLTSSDQLDIPQRELVQRENYLREKMFALIAGRLRSTPEAVAAKFAELAKRSSPEIP